MSGSTGIGFGVPGEVVDSEFLDVVQGVVVGGWL